MAEVALIKQILDLYPRFFTRNPESNHVKYHTALSAEFLNLIRESYIVSMATQLVRPLKLWKEQEVPYNYNMNYEVNLTDIKQVKLYLDNSHGLSGNEMLDFNANQMGIFNSPNIIDLDDNIIATLNGSDIEDINGNIIATYTGGILSDINGNIIGIYTNNTLYDENWSIVFVLGDLIESNSGILLQDSGILPLGTDTYSNNYLATDIDIIPTQKYYIDVIDYHENEFKKGYPENNVATGDIYDHDEALDTIGVNNMTPRRNYPNSNNITPNEYQNTYPPYFLDKTEADYWYEERLKIEANTYGKLPLVATEIYKYLGVYPNNSLNPYYPIGRWRQVCKMGTGNPEDQFCGDVMGTLNGDIPTDGCKHIQTKEWNSAVFDVWIDIRSIPINIAYSEPNEDVLQSIIDRTFSLGKRAYLQYNLSESMVDTTSVSDTIIGITGIGFENENINITESFKLLSTFSIENDTISVNELIVVTLNNRYYTSNTGFLMGNIDINNPILITNKGTRVYGSLETGRLVDKYGNRYIMRSE